MVTIKLKKKAAAVAADAPRRPPVRGAGSAPRVRPTLAQAQADREAAAREAPPEAPRRPTDGPRGRAARGNDPRGRPAFGDDPRGLPARGDDPRRGAPPPDPRRRSAPPAQGGAGFGPRPPDRERPRAAGPATPRDAKPPVRGPRDRPVSSVDPRERAPFDRGAAPPADPRDRTSMPRDRRDRAPSAKDQRDRAPAPRDQHDPRHRAPVPHDARDHAPSPHDRRDRAATAPADARAQRDPRAPRGHAPLPRDPRGLGPPLHGQRNLGPSPHGQRNLGPSSRDHRGPSSLDPRDRAPSSNDPRDRPPSARDLRDRGPSARDHRDRAPSAHDPRDPPQPRHDARDGAPASVDRRPPAQRPAAPPATARRNDGPPDPRRPPFDGTSTDPRHASAAPRAHRDDDEDEDRPLPEHPPGSVRLSKRMSELGIASRREADEWIEKGWVRVDDQTVNTLGSRVLPGQRVTVDAKARFQQAQRVTVLVHKPVGYVSGQAEDGYEPAVVLVTPENQWREDRSGTRFLREHLKSLVPAGRLDIDSVGLLVLTQDGRVAKQLIGEDSAVEKEYLVRVASAPGESLSDEGLAMLRHGLSLDGEALAPATVEWVNADQLRFVLTEGKKRQIRRMCDAVGLQVLGLKRVRIGQVMLGDLPPGQWRYLRRDEAFG